MLTCPNCARENPEGSAFCNGCAAALTAQLVREVRKTVTVLFCDVAGSTAMGERLDPEFSYGPIGGSWGSGFNPPDINTLSTG